MGDGGFPVGLMAHEEYSAVTVPLTPGSRVILYSDGMTECTNPEGVQYGEERLHALFDQARDWPLNTLEPILYETLTTWQGGRRFEDDVSVLAFEVVTRHRGK
ncbi:PP2C family protein-serine/threonine phosphatase [Niveispirillum sp. KHB5.9]|uniref:PP2C family protein-serine/threonine phosphatase n=1 Tax=Niveispirillum sp. KHB5.9 TaxID=3400269 RepID=UPI003A86C655